MNFYFQAAKALERLDAKQGSIKSILATLPEKDRKRTAALVIETLKYKPVLSDIIFASKLLKEEKKITSMNLALVLVHDFLLSNGIEAGDGPVKTAVLRHKTRLRSEFQRLKIKRGAKSNQELAQPEDPRVAKIPRYVRVNSLLWTAEEATQSFISRGFTPTSPEAITGQGFVKDHHVPDLFLFAPQTQFHESAAYKAGKLILQDKASCFPAIVLSPPVSENGAVIDATAAPGNKTSHLSALMRNTGKLFAFERDQKRFSTLQYMLKKAGCRNVETINTDFLNVSPEDEKYAAVTHILLDPSCSGSGIVNRLDYLLEPENDNDSVDTERLNKLASFQLSMIKHAMKFPGVVKIVYSTCSIHAAENERVVCQALKSEEAQAAHYTLAPKEIVLPDWPRRGIPEEMDNFEQAPSVIRCRPGDDATNGFFVACFIKTSQQDVQVTSGKRKVDTGTEEHDAPEKHGTIAKHKRKKKRQRTS
ncbi:S-adenosyl-L-methionine-dependent methyltransferase [Neolentinus lepideus HHB14362 ss-1]|uniref:S-adenosyl-L-methionine-dependent methyltransferase n=1 Tax=Neolentinus lepideus HHB14362 ss-1 TaxID=1314782 RepID=A0A165VHS2_9AGAM|nr:S-adenosyl-L-methionine-dependent methyltransferase [Neolentinus lepideus HHB14362 ss-1]